MSIGYMVYVEFTITKMLYESCFFICWFRYGDLALFPWEDLQYMAN